MALNAQSRREAARYCACGHHRFDHRIPWLYMTAKASDLDDETVNECLRIDCDCPSWNGPTLEEWTTYWRLKGEPIPPY